MITYHTVNKVYEEMIHIVCGRICCFVYQRAQFWVIICLTYFKTDLFFILNNTGIANHADDTTPYAASEHVNDLTASLEKSSKDLFKWFDDNLITIVPISAIYSLVLVNK